MPHLIVLERDVREFGDGSARRVCRVAATDETQRLVVLLILRDARVAQHGHRAIGGQAALDITVDVGPSSRGWCVAARSLERRNTPAPATLLPARKHGDIAAAVVIEV